MDTHARSLGLSLRKIIKMKLEQNLGKISFSQLDLDLSNQSVLTSSMTTPVVS